MVKEKLKAVLGFIFPKTHNKVSALCFFCFSPSLFSCLFTNEDMVITPFRIMVLVALIVDWVLCIPHNNSQKTAIVVAYLTLLGCIVGSYMESGTLICLYVSIVIFLLYSIVVFFRYDGLNDDE